MNTGFLLPLPTRWATSERRLSPITTMAGAATGTVVLGVEEFRVIGDLDAPAGGPAGAFRGRHLAAQCCCSCCPRSAGSDCSRSVTGPGRSAADPGPSLELAPRLPDSGESRIRSAGPARRTARTRAVNLAGVVLTPDQALGVTPLMTRNAVQGCCRWGWRGI
jgi:hypothetical protein